MYSKDTEKHLKEPVMKSMLMNEKRDSAVEALKATYDMILDVSRETEEVIWKTRFLTSFCANEISFKNIVS